MGRKLLIIDDSRILHPLVRAKLAGEGLEFHSAYDGESGLALARSVQPDIILLDVEMPEPTGFEVCDRLKADAATADIPVIFITGASATHDKINGLNKGAVDYLTKPFDPAELLARVRSALRTRHLMALLTDTAMTDGLTGLRNRAYLDQRLAAEISLVRRDGRPLSCAMADLDRFKTLNDEYGHPFGDHVLKRTAETLQTTCRTEDILCRYGGEEFAILFPGTTLERGCAVADRLRASLDQSRLTCGKATVTVTASLGVAQFETDEPAHRFLGRVDQAQRRAKAMGGNVVFPAVPQTALVAVSA